MMSKKIINDWTTEHLGKLIKPENTGERFVLMLGAPKSGVEELSTMLGQLEGVSVVGPLETMGTVCVRHLNARQGVLRPVPFEPTKLRGAQLKDGGAEYSTQASAMSVLDDASKLVDTHPLNIPLAGAAAMMLPGINIVICQRDPMESTIACYCDAMVGNHPYSGDLVNAAGFVSDCNRMLEHWATTLGDEAVGANIIEVSFAELAKDPKKIAAKVAREMGLDVQATAIKRTPSFDRGPGTHPDAYTSFTKPIAGFFDTSAT